MTLCNRDACLDLKTPMKSHGIRVVSEPCELKSHFYVTQDFVELQCTRTGLGLRVQPMSSALHATS
jgi:hypothetical protein